MQGRHPPRQGLLLVQGAIIAALLGVLAADLFRADLAVVVAALRATANRPQRTETPTVADTDIIGAALGSARRRGAYGDRRRALYD
jgi:hypothetical protein